MLITNLLLNNNMIKNIFLFELRTEQILIGPTIERIRMIYDHIVM